MDDKKEKTGFWQSWMTIALLLAMTLMVVWFNSQGPIVRSEPDENISIGNNVNISIGNNVNMSIANDTNVPTEKMNNDTFFKNWVSVSFDVIKENLDCISTAGYKKDIVNMERCGRFLSDNSNTSLKNINEYSISSSMQKLSDEYRQALEDYNAGGTILEIGAKNENASQMGLAAKYIQSGNMHIEVVNVLFQGNASSFVHPQPGVNTTE